jgi:glucose-6-phosphate isomerase
VSLGPAAGAVQDAWSRAAAERLGERVCAGDAAVFGPRADSALDGLGWLRAPFEMRRRVAEVEELVRSCRAEGVRHALVLGMGGSSLSPEVTRRTFGHSAGIELRVLDSTAPGAVRAAARGVDPEHAVYVVASKSGVTLEALDFLSYFRTQVEAAVGPAGTGGRFIAITDPGTPLVRQAREGEFRRVLQNPPDIVGRYSALSLFGLVPMAFAGVPLHPVLDRAQAALATDAGPRLGVALATLALAGRDKLTIVADPVLEAFSPWVEQLLAESLGKDGTGIVPVADEPLGEVDEHGDDRAVLYLRMTGDREPHVRELAAAGHPALILDAVDGFDAGGLYMVLEIATACAGVVLGVNPFDQPDVQASKDATRRVLGGLGPVGTPVASLAPREALTRAAELCGPGDYLALQAFCTPSPAMDRALSRIRRGIRADRGVATTAGYGPRFLHSTGQLHKGGPPSGVFVQLVADTPDDVPVPRRSYSFGDVMRAQALGDAQALAARGRRLVRVELGPDPAGTLRRAADTLARW